MHGRSIEIRLRDIKKLMKENPIEYAKQVREDEKEMQELLSDCDNRRKSK